MPDEPHPYQIYADVFTKEDVPELLQFDCGAEAWSRAATEWIVGNDVWESIEKRRTKVWLYRLESDVIVGFGSLGVTRRKWPSPEGGFSNLLIIPMLGMDHHFHGQPPDARFRYSNQILSHLRFEAMQELQERQKNTLPLLALYVHRDNARAIRLYQRFGFAVEAAASRGDLLMMIQRIDSGDENPPVST